METEKTKQRNWPIVMAAGAVLVAGGKRAIADTINWSSTAATTTWATGANWVNGVPPANSITQDIAQFDQASYLQMPNAGTTSVAGLVMGDASGNLNNNGGTPTIGNAAALILSGTSLSIGASGLLMNANVSGDLTLSPTITVAAAQTWTNNSASNVSVNGNLVYTGQLTLGGSGSGSISLAGSDSGAGGVVISGANVILSGTNGIATYFGTGSLELHTGSLNFRAGHSVATLGNALTLSGNFTIDAGDTTHVISFSGPTTVTSAATLTLLSSTGASTAGETFSGAITANADLGFAGTRNISLTGGLSAGTTGLKTLTLGNSGVTTISTVGLSDGSGQVALAITGGGTTTMTVASTYTGGTLIASGTLKLGATNALPTGGIITLGGSGTAGTLDVGNGGAGLSAQVGGIAVAAGATASNQTITSSATSGGSVLTIDTSAGSSSFAGNITGSRLGLTKQGSNSLTLAGTNTYSSTTNINGGALIIDGSTGASAFKVNSGGTLAGAGTIGGSVTLATGGVIAPGDNGIGKLTTGALTATGGTMSFEIKTSNNTADELVASSVNLGSNAVTLDLEFPDNFNGAYNQTFTLIENTGSGGTSGSFVGLPVGAGTATFNTSSLAYTINYKANVDSGSVANDVTITFSQVPEPITAALLPGAAMAMLLSRRRARRVVS